MEQLLKALAESRRVLVFTGAGVSVDSGIPDFRSGGGVWDQVSPRTLSRDRLESGRRGRVQFWQALKRLAELVGHPEPNDTHRALAALEAAGRVVGVVTQNVDGLHQRAGSHKVIELHGNLSTCSCSACGRRFPTDEIRARLTAGEPAPECDDCGSPIRPDIIVFGDPLPDDALDQAFALARRCDLCLVLGTSLSVEPAARIPAAAKEAGAILAIVTLAGTPQDEQADVRVFGPLSETLVPAIRALLSEAL